MAAPSHTHPTFLPVDGLVLRPADVMLVSIPVGEAARRWTQQFGTAHVMTPLHFSRQEQMDAMEHFFTWLASVAVISVQSLSVDIRRARALQSILILLESLCIHLGDQVSC